MVLCVGIVVGPSQVFPAEPLHFPQRTPTGRRHQLRRNPSINSVRQQPWWLKAEFSYILLPFRAEMFIFEITALDYSDIFW